MRTAFLALLVVAALALAGCCNIPCDPCCPPCQAIATKPSLFKNPPPRFAPPPTETIEFEPVPGEVPAPGAPATSPPGTPVPPPGAPTTIPEAPETLESK